MFLELQYPDPRLNPNKRQHWSRLSSAKKIAREYAFWMAKGDSMTESYTAPLKVSVTFYPPDNRRRDKDNMIASFKAYQDGIAGAIGVDDADWDVTYRLVKEPSGKVEVLIGA